jgi:hypothetical protein
MSSPGRPVHPFISHAHRHSLKMISLSNRSCPEMGPTSGFLRPSALVGSMREREQRRSRMLVQAVNERWQRQW